MTDIPECARRGHDLHKETVAPCMLPRFVGMFRSGRGDLSVRAKAIIRCLRCDFSVEQPSPAEVNETRRL